MTRVQLLTLVVLAFVLLINYAARLLKKRVESTAPPASVSEGSETSLRARRVPPIVALRRFHEAPGATPLPLAVPPVTLRPRARAPLGGLRAVRRGIVLMTILGPCRALEPPSPRA